jgi:polysaccharide chain length determinant protein (PEP-CTERM system associated)
MDKTGTTPSEMVRKYLKMVIKRKYLFIILSLSVISLFVWGSYFITKKYEAKSTVFIESNVIKNLVSGLAITPSMEDRIRVLGYAILSRDLLLKVLQDLDVDIQQKTNIEERIKDYQTRTKINLRGNELFTVSIIDSDPKLATNYINTLVRKYVEENISAKREEAYGANRFLNEQVVQFKEKLDKTDDNIINFRKEKGIYVAVDESSVIQEIKEFKKEIEKINLMRNQLVATKNVTQLQLKNEEPYSVVFSRHLGSGDENALIAVLENRIKQLLVQYTENYPEVIKVKAEIEALKKRQAEKPQGETAEKKQNLTEPEMSAMNPIYQQLKQTFLETEAELDALDAKKRQLAVLIAQKETELRYIPEGKKVLSDLEKERDSYKNIYEQLLARVGQSEVSKQMEIGDKTTTFRIVDPAIMPTKPVSPNRVKLILSGILFGIMAGFAGVFVRETFDNSIKDTETLKNLGVEILAVIPKIFNEEEQKRLRKKDRLIYGVAGSYFLIICSVLLYEVLDKYIL